MMSKKEIEELELDLSFELSESIHSFAECIAEDLAESMARRIASDPTGELTLVDCIKAALTEKVGSLARGIANGVSEVREADTTSEEEEGRCPYGYFDCTGFIEDGGDSCGAFGFPGCEAGVACLAADAAKKPVLQ